MMSTQPVPRRPNPHTPPPLAIHLESSYFPCDNIQITRMTGKETISQLFRFEIFFTCLAPWDVNIKEIAGAKATLVFVAEGREVRRQYGLIAEAADLLDSETMYGNYRIVLVPRPWQLTLIHMQEIYIGMTIPDIIKKKAELIGIAGDLEFRLLGDYPAREFIVQYNETDIAFISRLCEHVGISFMFEQVEKTEDAPGTKHQAQAAGDRWIRRDANGNPVADPDEHIVRDHWIFTDHAEGFKDVAGAERALFRARGERQDIFKLDLTTRLIPVLYVVSDYNYENPQVDLTSSCPVADGFGGGVVEYGTNFKDQDQGLKLAKVRAQERMVESHFFQGESGICTLTAGARVGVDDHPRIPECELLIVEIEHHLVQAALGHASGQEQPRYTNAFRAIPAKATYRPPRITPRPRIYGVTHGITDTEPGVEVEHPWIDKHGRYIVRMLFDTANPGERKASLPVRMAQASSGPNYGVHFPLRPGTEVLIAFVDGDPDRPLIIGSVPNAVTPTPVNESENTLHRMRTWSGVLVEIDDGG